MDEKPTYEELERRIQQFQKSESELKMTEKNLWEREERYRSLIDSSPLPFLITQKEKIVFVNPAVLGLFGVKNENEIIGSSPKAWIHPDFIESAFQRRCQALEKNEALEPVELTLVRKDGHEIAVLANTVCIRHTGMPAILSMFQDITERKKADESLRKSEAKHSKMLANIGDVIVIIDQEGINRYKSPNIKKIFGWKPEEVVGANTWDNVHPDDIEFTQQFFEKIMHTPDAVGTMECRYRCKDGSYKWIEFSGSNLFHDPDIQGLLGNYQDITERKQAENALIESEALFRGMFKDHSAVMLLIDPNTGQIVEANQSAAQYYGYPLENMNQMKIQHLNLLSPAEIMEKMGGAFNKQVNIFEFRHVLEDGHIRDVEVHSTPIAIQNQTLLFSIIHDITKRKQSQKALRESERFLRSTVDGLTAHITVLDDRGDIVLTNEAYRNFAEQNGIEPHTVSEGANYLAVCDTASGEHSDEAIFFAKGIRDVLSGERRSFQLEYPCHSPGEKRWFVGHVTSFLGEGPRRVIVAHENITERKQAEAENEKLQEQLSQIKKSESLNRMAGAIAHHFNNQLSVMMGNMELVLDDLPDNAENRENLSQAFEAGHKAAEVSQQMLRYLGHISGTQITIDLSNVCRQSLALLPHALPRGVTLNVDFPDSGPFIHADAGQIQQVLTNLFTNAQESLPDNKGIIGLIIQTVFHEEIPTSKRFPLDWQPQDIIYACLEISDTGCGISKKDIVKIFDPFYTTKFTGRGMGLPVTMGFLKTHGGCITVVTEPENGSVFRVYLPVTTERKPAKHKKVTTPKGKVGNGGTVLLIEDEEGVRNTAKAMLTRLGYAVIEAQDGVVAKRLFQEHQNEIDCVLSDLTMPRMNGWETLAALRKEGCDVPIILASGYDEATVMVGDHPELPQAFLNKPYSMAALKDVLMEVIRL